MKPWIAVAWIGTMFMACHHETRLPQKHVVWRRAADLNIPSALHSTAVLKDGRVLLAGGVDAREKKRTYLSRTEVYDPQIDRWTAGPPLSQSRAGLVMADPHTMTLLNDGRVLLAGGVKMDIANEKNFTPTLETEIFDPGKGSWELAAAMRQRRTSHVALLLPDGRVLVAGRWDTTEIYDPVKNEWLDAGKMPHQVFLTRGIVLPDGRVLMTGGYWERTPYRECSIYDPHTGQWTPAASMHHARSWHMITLLKDGRVLVAGGYTGNNKDTEGIEATNTAEIYDPKTGTWTETGSLHDPRYDTEFVVLPDGRVLVAGGATGAVITALSSCEIYDPATGTWSVTTPLSHIRRSHRTVLLPNGEILITGGFKSWFEGTYSDCEIGTYQDQ